MRHWAYEHMGKKGEPLGIGESGIYIGQRMFSGHIGAPVGIALHGIGPVMFLRIAVFIACLIVWISIFPMALANTGIGNCMRHPTHMH